jgi:seryl-tRNA synthetase
MLDIKLIRENPELIRINIKNRFAEEMLPVLEEAIQTDADWRKSQDELNNLRHQKNVLDGKVKALKAEGKAAEEEIESSRKVAAEIKDLEEGVRTKREILNAAMIRLPNLTHESVPRGETENDNVEVGRWGAQPVFPFEVKDHIDLGLDLDLFDLERGASVAGARWYYLKNELVLLQLAVMRFAIDRMVREGFTPIYPPAMIRERVMEGAGFLPDGREDIYKIEEEDLFAVGTSEQALAGLHEGDILEAQQLPLLYTGISPCFRTEAGSHGRDTKGIFRVHQFEKVEMFIFSLPENSWNEIEKMRAIAEGLFRDLDIPFRVVDVCTGELSSVVAKRYDLEAWLPGQNKYREMVSCSNCLDYQARRLRVRYREAPGKPTRFVHTLNSTALASTRTLIAIMENHQTSEGHIAIPRALRHYLPGIDIIKRD